MPLSENSMGDKGEAYPLNRQWLDASRHTRLQHGQAGRRDERTTDLSPFEGQTIRMDKDSLDLHILHSAVNVMSPETSTSTFLMDFTGKEK